MTDPLGLIPSPGPLAPAGGLRPAPPGGRAGAPDFHSFLQEQIAKVNELEQDAKEAAEDIIAGRRDDIEGVILATQKADTAFRMLLQVRNKMMDAYEEIKQIRV